MIFTASHIMDCIRLKLEWEFWAHCSSFLSKYLLIGESCWGVRQLSCKTIKSVSFPGWPSRAAPCGILRSRWWRRRGNSVRNHKTQLRALPSTHWEHCEQGLGLKYDWEQYKTWLGTVQDLTGNSTRHDWEQYKTWLGTVQDMTGLKYDWEQYKTWRG